MLHFLVDVWLLKINNPHESTCQFELQVYYMFSLDDNVYFTFIGYKYKEVI